MREFSLKNIDLHGANLIEASAGTGKTYTISALYLRLILEKNLPVDSILVVTFTRAATAELKSRLRAALVLAQRFIQTDGLCEDAQLKALFEQSLEVCGSRKEFSERVSRALQTFDEASIFTIHGFCQRAIKTNALLARAAFEMELSADTEKLYDSVIFDYWRERLLPHESLVKSLQAHQFLPEVKKNPYRSQSENYWQSALKLALRGQNRQVLWPTFLTQADMTTLQNLLDSETVVQYVNEVERLFRTDGLEKRKKTIKQLSSFAEVLEAWRRVSLTDPKLDDIGHLLLDGELRARKGHALPEYPSEMFVLRDYSQRLSFQSYATSYDVLKRFYEEAPLLYQQKKSALGITTFDDMLTGLAEALQGEEGEALADALRSRYRAALIDEFQDTDAVQYAIFKRIFMNDPEQSTFVCFVGDPKQAIYRFRGADIQTYLNARENVAFDRRFTLKKNYRSTDALIAVVNRLFSASDAFGVENSIPYEPVDCGKPKRVGLMRGGRVLPALSVTKVDKSVTNEAIYQETALRIQSYLNDSSLTCDGRAVKASDMAILLRNRFEIADMQQALGRLGIESRVITSEQIYQTTDAQEIEMVLRAVINPRDLRTLKTALATRLVGLDALTVYRIGVDEETSQPEATLHYWLKCFGEYRQFWQKFGAGNMLTRLVKDRETVKRYLSETDGSRRLTNLYHLIEELYALSLEYRSPEALVENFGQKTNAIEVEDDENKDVLRMQSDANIVTIMTYHKSKGLEFPVVFLPMADQLQMEEKNLAGLFQEYVKNGETWVSVKVPGQGHTEASKIRNHYLAEYKRVFYVAVTRASRRLEIFDRGNSQSIMAQLTQQNWDPFVMSGLADIQEGLCEAVALTTPRAKSKKLPIDLKVLPSPGRGRTWSMTSYSRMVDQIDREKDHYEEVLPTRNNAEVLELLFQSGLPSEDILRFPRGAEAGEALHLILETIDFVDGQHHGRDIDAALDRYFPNHPERESLKAQIAHMLEDLLNVDLGLGWHLKDISRQQRISELEFLLATDNVQSVSRLMQRIRQENRLGYRLSYNEDTRISALQGFLKGFMDLVIEVEGRFYILDWKSNFLYFYDLPEKTSSVIDVFIEQNYNQASLGRAIEEHAYALQYLLYTVALHRLLKVRLGNTYDYDRHIGGVFYVFVRGVRARKSQAGSTPLGVWFDRPNRDLIEDLDRLLGDWND